MQTASSLRLPPSDFEPLPLLRSLPALSRETVDRRKTMQAPRQSRFLRIFPKTRFEDLNGGDDASGLSRIRHSTLH